MRTRPEVIRCTVRAVDPHARAGGIWGGAANYGPISAGPTSARFLLRSCDGVFFANVPENVARADSRDADLALHWATVKHHSGNTIRDQVMREIYSAMWKVRA